MDLCGPMPNESKGGNRYLATFLDDYSKLSLVQPLKRRATFQPSLSKYLLVWNQKLEKVKAVQTDKGGEYVNEEMMAFLGKRGIVHRKTAGYSPEQNGSAERLNRDLEEKGRAMLEDSGFGEELWAEAMVTATIFVTGCLQECMGRLLGRFSLGSKPDISHMRVFGARVYMHIPRRKEKDQPVSEEGIFVGYEPDCKAYRVMRERDGRTWSPVMSSLTKNPLGPLNSAQILGK